MGLYSTFKTSEEHERDGVSFVFGNTRITGARAGGANKPYVKALSEYQQKNGRALELDAISENSQLQALIEFYADYIVKGWETNLNEEGGKDDKGAWINPDWKDGIESEDGGDLLPVTRENVIATFKNLPDLFVAFKASCEKVRNYRKQTVGRIVGN